MLSLQLVKIFVHVQTKHPTSRVNKKKLDFVMKSSAKVIHLF